MEKLRLAVIGAGRLGRFHAQKIAAHDDAELVAVVDPIAENRDRVAAECRTQSLPDYDTIIGQFDAAVIATPTESHYAVAADCLQRGLHLLVEKPLCRTRAEADQLAELARANGLVLQVGHVERFNPAFAAAAAKARDPKYIEAVRASQFTFRSTDIGVVFDLMIHDIDLVLAMVGSRVRRIDALGFSVVGGHEDVANVRLHFESGCVANLSASRVSCEPTRRMHVWSAEAFAGIDFATRRTTVVRPSEALRRRQFDLNALSPAEIDHYRTHFADEHLPREELEFSAVDALALELDDFVRAIAERRQPRVNGDAGREAVAVAEQILARIAAHAWDEQVDGPVGPLAIPRPRIVPAPHFITSAQMHRARREAG